MRPSEIARLLAARGFRSVRALGQNFLFDPKLLEVICTVGEVSARDAVLEVGTGPGTLTAALAMRAGRVVTVEVDRRLEGLAREVVPSEALERVRFVHGDVLEGPAGLHPRVEEELLRAAREGLRPKCVSNFPYGVATALITRLLERSRVEGAFPIELIAGTVQEEVAERLAARPSLRGGGASGTARLSRQYGLSSVLVQFLAEVTIERRIGKTAFYPPPKVSSALVRIRPRGPSGPAAADYRALKTLARMLFQFRRKTLRNALLHGLGRAEDVSCSIGDLLRDVGLDPAGRIEHLSIDRLVALAQRLRPVFLDMRG